MENVRVEELALQRKRYAHLTDEEFRFMLQQVEGRQRTRDKLPSFAEIEDWWYPVRLSCEQCSSEITARYKAGLTTKSGEYSRLVDLTGGYGVDMYFMSEYVAEAHYIERNEELCRIAKHNFELTRPYVVVHNSSAEEFLAEYKDLEDTLIYLDPARRDTHGGKVFRIEDCVPNVITLLPILKQAKKVVIKLSPMLDITAALRSLDMSFDVHIVAVKNEVKEVLLVQAEGEGKIYATNILDDQTQQVFCFLADEEKLSECLIYHKEWSHLIDKGAYIYEPNAAIIKSGAYKLIGERYGLCKMGVSTHLYLSKDYVADFPGRVWEIVETNIKEAKGINANVMTRNYPITADQLRKKLKVKDSDTHTIIGARLGDKPTLFLCKRV
jgi:hypothetical protein